MSEPSNPITRDRREAHRRAFWAGVHMAQDGQPVSAAVEQRLYDEWRATITKDSRP